MDFHRRRMPATLTPESLYTLAMFLFERTANVLKALHFVFPVCWMECVGWWGREDVEGEGRGLRV